MTIMYEQDLPPPDIKIPQTRPNRGSAPARRDVSLGLVVLLGAPVGAVR